MVYVVGPRFEKTFEKSHPSSSAPIEVKIGDVQFLQQLGGLFVEVTARGTGKTPVIPKMAVRIGNTRYELGEPPSTYQPSGSPTIYRPGDTDLVKRGNAILYFGPSESEGERVALCPTGALEVDVPGAAYPMFVPFGIPVPRRTMVNDDDALNELSSWFSSLGDVEARRVIKFADVDQELGLPDGTAERLLEKAVSEYWQVVRKGPGSILFKFRTQLHNSNDDYVRRGAGGF